MALLIFLIVLAVPGATLQPTAVLWSAVAHEPYGRVSKMHSQNKKFTAEVQTVLKGTTEVHLISKSDLWTAVFTSVMWSYTVVQSVVMFTKAAVM